MTTFMVLGLGEDFAENLFLEFIVYGCCAADASAWGP